MYRLVKFPGIKVYRPKVITSHIPTKICTLCQVHNLKPSFNLKSGNKVNIIPLRQHTTNSEFMHDNELTKRKRFRKNKKYFTELLEVFSDTAKQTKLSVKNMKGKELTRFADKFNSSHKPKKKQKLNTLSYTNDLEERLNNTVDENNYEKREMPEFSTGKEFTSSNELFLKNSLLRKMSTSSSEILGQDGNEKTVNKLSDLIDSLHNVRVTDVLNTLPVDQQLQEDIVEDLSELQHEEMSDEVDLISNEALVTEKTTVPSEINNGRTLHLKPSAKEYLAKEKIVDLEKMSREKAFNTTLHAFVKLCVSCNLLQRGIATLHYYLYRSKMSGKNPKVTDVRIFEELMHGFAAKGKQNKVDELWKLMIGCDLNPSLEIFASSLECIARSTNDRHKIFYLLKSMKEKGLILNDIFVNCTFLGNQREMILQAIHVVDPNFQPVVPPPSICYNCLLLQEVNENQGTNSKLRSPAEGIMSKTDLSKCAEEQFNNELSFYFKVKSIEKRIESEESLKIHKKKLDSMKAFWVEQLKRSFEVNVTLLKHTRKSSSVSLLPYLRVLSTQSYVDIMLKEIQVLAEGSETFSPSTAQLFRNLGLQVKNRYIVKYKKNHRIIDKTKMLYDKYCDWYLDPLSNNMRSCNGRQEWQQLIHNHQNGPSIVGDDEYWPSTVLMAIGRFLYNIITSDVKIDVNILSKRSKEHLLPAFYRVYRPQGMKTVEEIKPHPVISKLFRAAGDDQIIFDISLVPMLSPPLPWTSYQCGGYLLTKTDIIRLPDQALQQRQRLKEAPPSQLYPSLDSLNQLGSIPWKVNKPVLDTVIEVFNNGGSSKLEIPEPPHAGPVAEPAHPLMSKQERFQAFRQRMLLRRQKAEMYSLWCDALYKLSLANHFRDRIFWLPHNMDFRGRVYPCPPHLNHLGADMSRSLLCFAKGKPLGPTGLDWLKIHLVNLLGTKKRNSVQDRLDYANTIMPDILDSADNPLSGKGWWMESECPWQTLACCMEIHAALQHPDGPQHFVSQFPVHQDGSCNGLQHYAALGRDEAGACSVNLMPQDLPQDVYSCVAALVERERIRDSSQGHKVAVALDGYVRRKVIKQTVMTTVYGVTRFGARLQIAKQLKDIDTFPKDLVWPASTYLVSKTFESLREMFNSTKEIQDWFTECARLVSQIRGENMEYVTPLGLPVVQYYSRQLKKPDTKLGNLQEYFSIDMFERPNVMKQKNAFPPNFIHSLDSSHMMLTSIFSEQSGITFVSVHDCFWTHACTVPIMNQICREQFVALHSQPILEDLSKFMLKKYGYDEIDMSSERNTLIEVKEKLHTTLAQVPRKGTFILENVLDSIYFFS